MNKTQIIAEIGQNHEGDVEVAKKLIDQAIDGNADIIKLQYWNVDNIYDKKDIRYKAAKERELPFEKFQELSCAVLNQHKPLCVSFFGADNTQKAWIFEHADIIKYASSEVKQYIIDRSTWPEYVDTKPVLISAGYMWPSECGANVHKLACTPQYPTWNPQNGLRDLSAALKSGETQIGFSDHAIGIDACKAAILLGATYVEKHFTTSELRNTSKFRDHIGSMTITELQQLVAFRDKHYSNATDPDFIEKTEDGKRRIKTI